MEYWHFLWVISRRKWLIVCLVILSILATYASVKIWPSPIEARTTILFNFRTPKDVDVFDDKVYVDPKSAVEHYNFMTMFNSPSVIAEALKEASKETDVSNVDVARMREIGKASLSLVKVGGNDEKTSIVEYIVAMNDPVKAVALSKAVAQVAILRYKELLTESVVRSREYLQQQVGNSKIELDEAQKQLEQFYNANPEFTRYLDRSTYSGETIRSESSKIDLEVELASLKSQIGNVKKDIEKYTKSPSDEVPVSIQSSPLINELRTQLIQLQVDRDKLLTKYKNDYPQVIKTSSEIREIRINLYNTYLTLLNESLKSLESRRDEVSASMGSMENLQVLSGDQYNIYSIKKLKYDSFTRDLTVAEDNYKMMKEKLSEALIREDEAKNRYTLAIIDQPVNPEDVFPKQGWFYRPMFKLIFAFFGSIIFTLILVFMMDYFEVRYKTTTDISTLLDLPILGEIPEYKTGRQAETKGK